MTLIKKILNYLCARKDCVASVSHKQYKAQLKDAVLHILHPRFKCSRLGVIFGTDSQKTIDYERNLITQCRTWLKEQQDKDLIQAYNYWLEYFENNLWEAQKALDTGEREKWERKRRNDGDDYDKKVKFAAIISRPGCFK